MSTRKSSAVRPTTETGSSGSLADSATDSANGMFFSNSAWTSSSSSGKSKPLPQSVASHSSSGTDSEAASQVDISGVKPERAEQLGHVGVGVPVGGVELGGDVRVVALDGRVLVVAGHGLVDDVVRGRCRDLPAGAVEQQLGGRVVVDEELEADPSDEGLERLRLRLGVRARDRGRSRWRGSERNPRCRSPTWWRSCG